MNNSISPLDGRYSSSIEDLIPYFSEMALMRYRLEIEIEYLIKLSNEKTIKELQPISNKQKKELQKIYLGFDVKDAKRIKKIEKTTNHDVKAIEYFICEKVNKSRCSLNFGKKMSLFSPNKQDKRHNSPDSCGVTK